MVCILFVVGFVLDKHREKSYPHANVVRRNMVIAYWTGLIAALALGEIYLFQRFYTDFMYSFTNVVSPLSAGVALISSIFALRRYWENLQSRLSKIWLSFAFGMFFWFLGEVGWAVYTLVFNVEIHYPSIADIFWLSGYVPLFIALYMYVGTFQPAISKRIVAIAGAIIGSVGVIAVSPLILSVAVGAAEQDLVTVGVSLSYPILDLVLFSEAILGLLVFTITRLKGRIGLAWLLINAAIIVNVVADISFSNATMYGAYYNGHPLELLFHWGYILFALAFFTHMKEL